MHIREHSEITKDGQVLVSGNSDTHVLDNFVSSMEERGHTLFSFFINKEGINELMDEYGRQVSSDEVLDSGYGNINWSYDFTIEDMLGMIMLFMEGFTQKEKMAFLMQFQSSVLGDMMISDDEDISSTDDIDII